MGSVFSSLNTSLTGLKANQFMVDVSGNNISNADNEFYSRQRVVSSPQSSTLLGNVFVGNGVGIDAIQRARDQFIFDRYSRASEDFNFTDTKLNYLKQLASYFPDINSISIYDDLKEFFEAWKNISVSSDDPSQKQILFDKSQNVVNSLHDVRNRLFILQKNASDDLGSYIREANDLGSEIANINRQIKLSESSLNNRDNTLRDRRDELEFKLRAIFGGRSNISDPSFKNGPSKNPSERYSFTIAGGIGFIDDEAFHPLILQDSGNSEGLNRVYIQGSNGNKDITDSLSRGKAGALISLFASSLDGGRVGRIQSYINLLDSFARGFIDSVNRVYSQSAVQSLSSFELGLRQDSILVDSPYNIKEGDLEFVVYDQEGNKLAQRLVSITRDTTLRDIINQINSDKDDNGDNNIDNDLDDYFKAIYTKEDGKLIIQPKDLSGQFYIAVKDKETNFMTGFGMNSYFDGSNAENIRVHDNYKHKIPDIRVDRIPGMRDFDIANRMQELQYENLYFDLGDNLGAKNMKIEEFYGFMVGEIASEVRSLENSFDTKKSILETIKKENLGISQVNLDEEMIKLMKFQSGYAANTKVITAIDKMIDTLLEMKQ